MNEDLQREKSRGGGSPEGRTSIAGGVSAISDKSIFYKDVALIRYRPDEEGESLV